MTDRAATISVRRLQAPPDSGLSGDTTPESRLALVAALTREAFALAGIADSVHARHEAPAVVRPLRPLVSDAPR